MLTLYSYPPLFGVADNNGYGLKVFAFLKLAGVPFEHRHVFDASTAPRKQLPYLSDDGEAIGDSDAIIAHVIRKHGATLDVGLNDEQRHLGLMLRRTLDDLYWVMSYSRWKDEAFWPAFSSALREQHPSLTEDALAGARAFNLDRYFYQGIGRFEPREAYARGIEDLSSIASLVPQQGYVFGERPGSADAAIYGFVANIIFYPIETPLRSFVVGQPHLVRHCEQVHRAIGRVA